jgi:hypothetical protein
VDGQFFEYDHTSFHYILYVGYILCFFIWVFRTILGGWHVNMDTWDV